MVKLMSILKSTPQPDVAEASETISVVRDVEDRKDKRRRTGRTAHFGARVRVEFREEFEALMLALSGQRKRKVTAGELFDDMLAAMQLLNGDGATAKGLRQLAEAEKWSVEEVIEDLV